MYVYKCVCIIRMCIQEIGKIKERLIEGEKESIWKS